MFKTAINHCLNAKKGAHKRSKKGAYFLRFCTHTFSICTRTFLGHFRSDSCNAYCYICRNLLNVSSGVVILATDVLAVFRPVLRLLKCQVFSGSSL